jgi:hypothetical protein
VKRVQIRLFPDGTVQAEVKGVKGKRCTDYIRILEELLEAETVDSDFTAEYFETEEEQLHYRESAALIEKLRDRSGGGGSFG